MSASSWTVAISLNVLGNLISAFGWMLQKKQHMRTSIEPSTNNSNSAVLCANNSGFDIELADVSAANVAPVATSTDETKDIDTNEVDNNTKSDNEHEKHSTVANKHKTNLRYVIAWRWWLGFLCYGGGSAVAAISYTYGPQSLLIPLETIILVFNIILGAKFLDEKMHIKDYFGISFIFVGVVISVLAAPKEQQPEYTIQQLVDLFAQASFWMFIACYSSIVFTGYMFYIVPSVYQYILSKFSNIFMIIFVNLSAYFGSWNAILLKSVLELMASSFDGKAKENFLHIATYLLFIGFIASLLMLEFWRQKALALYMSTYVLAVYRVFVTTGGVLFGAFYWNDFVGIETVYIAIYVIAILVSFVGVGLISLAADTKVFAWFYKTERNTPREEVEECKV